MLLFFVQKSAVSKDTAQCKLLLFSCVVIEVALNEDDGCTLVT